MSFRIIGPLFFFLFRWTCNCKVMPLFRQLKHNFTHTSYLKKYMREGLVFGYCFRMKRIGPDSIGLNPTKFDGIMSLVWLWHFSNFWTAWPKELGFSILIVFNMLVILMKVRFRCIHYWESYSPFWYINFSKIPDEHLHKIRQILTELCPFFDFDYIFPTFEPHDY